MGTTTPIDISWFKEWRKNMDLLIYGCYIELNGERIDPRKVEVKDGKMIIKDNEIYEKNRQNHSTRGSK